jgi:putative cell wall-binding protein
MKPSEVLEHMMHFLQIATRTSVGQQEDAQFAIFSALAQMFTRYYLGPYQRVEDFAFIEEKLSALAGEYVEESMERMAVRIIQGTFLDKQKQQQLETNGCSYHSRNIFGQTKTTAIGNDGSFNQVSC